MYDKQAAKDYRCLGIELFLQNNVAKLRSRILQLEWKNEVLLYKPLEHLAVIFYRLEHEVFSP